MGAKTCQGFQANQCKDRTVRSPAEESQPQKDVEKETERNKRITGGVVDTLVAFKSSLEDRGGI